MGITCCQVAGFLALSASGLSKLSPLQAYLPRADVKNEVGDLPGCKGSHFSMLMTTGNNWLKECLEQLGSKGTSRADKAEY